MTGSFKIGVFDDEEKMIASLRKLTEDGIDVFDVFTPYPLHDVIKLMKRKSMMPTAAYFYGLFAIIAVLSFLYYTSVIDWPVVYGGKPFNSFPSFIVVTLVLTIFTVTIASLATFSARARLYPGKENRIFDDRATDDMFLIVLDQEKLGGDKLESALNVFRKEGALEINDKTFEE